MRRFTRKQNIFTNKDALNESYQPERIQERDEEIDAYMNALQPVVDGWELFSSTVRHEQICA
jgi:archaeal cell division control protein 6